MKKSAFLLLTLSFLSAAAFGAEESKKEDAKPAGLSKKEISSGMSVVWCKKMDECAKDKSMAVGECQKILAKNFKEGLDNIPKGQKVEVTSENFDQCKQSIEAGTCDTLKTAHSLPGCDFITLLNRTN